MNAEVQKCQNCKTEFTIAPEDFDFYSRAKVPAPTFCPDCRSQRRLAWRNERSLYRRKCQAPGHSEDIVSMYDPGQPYNVVDSKFWWSDGWDPLVYGVEYDFSKPFFQQFDDLLKRVPLLTLNNVDSVNSEYTNWVAQNKNCYLCFAAGLNEDLWYSNKAFECKDSMDLLMCTRLQLSYDCVNCMDSYKLLYSTNSRNCTESYFLYNCRGCTNCFGCANLVNKQYYFFNEQLTKEAYEAKVKAHDLTKRETIEALWKKFTDEIYVKAIHRYANITNSVDCTGDSINASKNCYRCFDLFQNVEDSRYLTQCLELRDCHDCFGQYKHELSYENVDNNIGQHTIGSINVYNSNDIFYSMSCHGSNDLFGCIGLRNKKFCILNKQYTEPVYRDLIGRILKHMEDMPYSDAKGRDYRYGDFFPIELSPFCYNETIAQENFTMSRLEVESAGYRWKETDVKAASSGDHIVACGHGGKCQEKCTVSFRLLPHELEFYGKHGIPMPVLCPNCRHYARRKRRNPIKLWRRQCMCDQSGKHGHAVRCAVQFETPFAPDRPEIIYCEKCYQEEVA